jgi:pyridoxamine 5'-phosphate oxidase-like protein
MLTWSEFKEAAPGLATEGERLLRRGEIDEALLATVRGDGLPSIHPIYVRVVGDGLYAFVLRSAKRTDLEQDGRFALHTHQDPGAPSEFSVRGRARSVEAGAVRDLVAATWWFEVDDSYHLFEFTIEAAVLGVRADADEWPPRYTSWRAPAAT